MGRRELLALGVGWAFVASNSGLISFALPLIASEWALKGTQIGLLLNLYLLGMLIGGFALGKLADALGRKPAAVTSLTLLAIGTAACALAPNWVSMGLMRLLAGVGATGYMVVASTLLSELSPTEVRGRNVAILESFWAYGWLLASLLGLVIAPSKGWRPIFLAGVAPLAAIPLLKIVPESSMFLEEAAKPEKPPISSLFRGEYLRRTLMLWIHWFVIVMAYWGVFLWFPKVLVAQRGLTLVKSLQWSFLITLAQIPGYWSGAWVIERLGRRLSLSLYMGLAGLGALLYWFATTPNQALAGAIVLSFFNLGAWGITYAYTPELYPTSLRGLGSGAANSFGRLGGILGPYLVGAILDATGSYSLAFLTFGVAQLISAGVVAGLGVETAGRSLEEVSPGG